MSALKVLDCTLRDGGYYNNWRFDKDLVADYLNAINKSNIDVIEIGFRSIEKNKYFGEYAYSTDSYLNKIIKKFNFKIAVMINAKDLIEMETNNVRIEKFFKNKKLSKVDIIRVACHFEEVAKIIQGTANSSGATIIAQTYELGKKALEQDVNDAAFLAEDDTIDVYKFIVEGNGDSFAAGSTASGLDSTTPATNLETDILSVISSNDSAGNVAVRVGTLKAEGTASSGTTGRIFDARV